MATTSVRHRTRFKGAPSSPHLVRRWQKLTDRAATLASMGQTFAEVEAERTASAEAA